MYDYDLLVIGSGPAGEKAALEAADAGRSVAVIEKERVPGGTCANNGTLPSKTLREAALFSRSQQRRSLHGFAVSDLGQPLGISNFMHRERLVVDTEIRRIKEAFRQAGVTVMNGLASFEDTHTLAIEDRVGTRRTVSAAKILIASGSRPRRPDHIPFHHPKVNDSDLILRIQSIPDNMIVIGGGVVATEYAAIFQALGVSVTMIVRGRQILSFLDQDIARQAQTDLEDLGVYVILESEEEKVEIIDDTTLVITLTDGRTLPCESILFAAGRDGNTADLNLAAAGVDINKRGHIRVNDTMCTSNPDIYAAGDVIGWPALASASMMQGRVAATSALDLDYKLTMPRYLPFGIYTIPTISFVGKTEEQLQGDNIPYAIARADYKEVARAQIAGSTNGFLKMLFHPDTLEIHGIHVIGNRATELIHLGVMAISQCARLDYFEQVIFNYPTYAGMYKICARNGLVALRARQKEGANGAKDGI